MSSHIPTAVALRDPWALVHMGPRREPTNPSWAGARTHPLAQRCVPTVSRITQSSAAGGLLTGKMLPIHGTSQSGGYHYFLSSSARQLQRFVMRRLAHDDARRNASAHGAKDPASVRRRAGTGGAADSETARGEQPNDSVVICGPRRTQLRREEPLNSCRAGARTHRPAP